MQVKELNQPNLVVTEWARFLWRSSVTLATVLLGSALIMAIAANWFTWPKWGRVALLETTLISLVGVTWWLARRKPKDWARAFSLSSLALSLAAVCLGGLLALIGQSYQTGADPWQLFALWAVLLLPWAIGWSSLFIILLVMILTNVALVLYFSGAPFSVFGWLFNTDILLIAGSVINGLVWLLSLYCSSKVDDAYRLWSRFSLLLFIGYGVLWFSDANAFFSDSFLGNNIKPWLGVVFFGALTYWQHKKIQDVFAALVCLLATFYCAVWCIYAVLDALGAPGELFLLCAMGMGIASVFAVRFLIKSAIIQSKRAKEKQSHLELNPSIKQEPWYLRLALFGLQAFIVSTSLLWLYSIGFMQVFTEYLYIIQVALVVAIVYLLKRKPKSHRYGDIAFFLFAFGLLLSLIEGSFFSGKASTLELFWFLGLVLVVGVASGQHWLLQFFSTLAATSLLLGLLHLHIAEEASLLGLYSAQVVFVMWLLCSLLERYVQATTGRLGPLWWAFSLMMVFILGMNIQFEGSLSLSHKQTLFNLIALSVPVVGFYRFIPLVPNAVCMLFLAGLSGVWLWSIPMANFALAIGLIAYAAQQPTRLWFAGLLLSFALAQHYYTLDQALIEKAYLLAIAGGFLVVAAMVCFVCLLRTKKTALQMVSTRLPSSVVATLLGGLALAVILTSVDVWSKEKRIANGKTVILTLAPVDPRSLMQGDYMALSFALSSDLTTLNDNSSYLVYFDPQSSAPSLPLYVSSMSADQWWQWNIDLQQWQKRAGAPEIKDLPVIRMDYKQRQWLPNGIDAWFFAESQAVYYEQAKYGVFKTSPSGRALLVDMLNEQAQPIAAQSGLPEGEGF